VYTTAHIAPELTVCLGQVISDCRNPRSRLGKRPSALPFDDLSSDRNDGYELFRNTFNTKEKISASATVRSLLRFHLEGHRDQSKVGARIVHKILIEEFDPPADYVEDMFKLDAVQTYLKDNRFKKPIYMICGLKTALGGGVAVNQIENTRGGGGSLEAKISAKGITDAAALRAQFNKERTKGNLHEVKATQRFIFAYRLRIIKYDRKLKDKPYSEEVITFHGEEDPVPDDADLEDIEPSLNSLEDYSEGYQMADPDYDDAEPLDGDERENE
jgi:hypothetical protein